MRAVTIRPDGEITSDFYGGDEALLPVVYRQVGTDMVGCSRFTGLAEPMVTDYRIYFWYEDSAGTVDPTPNPLASVLYGFMVQGTVVIHRVYDGGSSVDLPSGFTEWLAELKERYQL